MSDDWRLRIDVHDPGHAAELSELLEAPELEHQLEASFSDRVVVSRDENEVFLYAGSRAQAEQAESLIRSLAAQHGWQVDTELKRWHPAEEEWEDPDKPVDDAAEHAALIEKEREEARERGYPEFEVRVQCRSRREAGQLAEQLREEGIPSVQRWRYLLVGALDEDSARALAERLRTEAPEGCSVNVEGTLQAVAAEQPRNPFAFFGGLGG